VTQNIASGTGRRKTSVARVYLRQGSGSIIVNGKKLDAYFGNKEHVYVVQQPLFAASADTTYDIMVNVNGGGHSGQAGAIRHGLSRALVGLDENLRSVMRANGFLTRDSRMVERKKYGQPGARKKFQFSKR
jgi:small subunit ribosomal protein S9